MAEPAPIRRFIAEPLSEDVREALDRLAASDDVARIAVMPDVHLADEVCVGTVVATTHTLYPGAVGGDIGCGMAAVRTTATRTDVDNAVAAARILAGFEVRVPVMAHRTPQTLPPELERPLVAGAVERAVRKDAMRQLGTLGRGNHFLELQIDEDDAVWLTVHTGSRGVGHAIRDHALTRCRRSRAGLMCLDADGADGAAYLADMAWARAFAAAGRARILHAAEEVLHDVTGARCAGNTAVACEHNHVDRVVRGQEDLLVHRKGAIPADVDVPGIIPGSMGAETFHVAGRGHAEALWSSSHGAGRCMSRTEARRHIDVRALARQVEGLWFDHRKSHRLVDEAPAAYKDITRVMRAQRDLTRIVRRLRPVLSYKGT